MQMFSLSRVAAYLFVCFTLQFFTNEVLAEKSSAGFLQNIPKGCQTVVKRLRRNAQRVSVRFDVRGGTLQEGGRIYTTWRKGKARWPRQAQTFLMFSMPQETRFEQVLRLRTIDRGNGTEKGASGPGFLGLPATARAPLSLPYKVDTMRALVPLNRRNGALPRSFRIKPYKVGAYQVDWAVVAKTKCGFVLVKEGKPYQVQVQSGIPKLIVQDAADLSKPKKAVLKAGYRLEIFEKHYRVFDAKSGKLLLQRGGMDPKFSSTGRFLTAVSQYTSSGILSDLIDLKVLRPVLGTQFGGVHWSEGDVFSLWFGVSSLIPGSQSVVHSLIDVEKKSVKQGHNFYYEFYLLDPWACNSCNRPKAHLDLDRLVMVFVDGDGGSFHPVQDLVTHKQDCCNGLSALRRKLRRIGSPIGYISASKLAPKGYWGKFLYGGAQIKKLKTVGIRTGSTGESRLRSTGWKSSTRNIVRSSQGNLQVNKFHFLKNIGIVASSPLKHKLLLERKEGLTVEPNIASKVRNELIFRFTDLKHKIPFPGKCGVGSYESQLCIVKGTIDLVHAEKVWLWETNRRKVALLLFSFENWGSRIGGKSGMVTVLLKERDKPTQVVLFNDDYGQIAPDFSYNFEHPIKPALFKDGRMSLYFGGQGVALICDTPECKKKSLIQKLPQPNNVSMPILPLGKSHILQVNGGGQFFVHSVRGKKSLLEGVVVDDEVVVWTPDLRFDSTPEGAHMMNLRFAGRPGLYTFHQFSKKLRTPGLVAHVLNGKTLRKVAVSAPPSLTGRVKSVTDGEVTGFVEVSSAQTLSMVKIYQDGVHTDTLTADQIQDVTSFVVKRLPGSRWLSFLAVDVSGQVSQPYGFELKVKSSKGNAIHVLSIGVNNYDDDRIPDLGLAAQDAGTIVKTIKAVTGQKSGGRRAGFSEVLVDGAAKRDVMLEKLKAAVSATRKGDTLLISYAGHGVKGKDGAYYLTTSDTRIADLANTAVAWRGVAELLKQAEGRIVLLIDACHSGAAGTDFFATNDDTAETLLASVPSNIIIIAASKGRELSYEDPDQGGGVFSLAFADVVAKERQKHDLNKNGVIEISELYIGVKRKVVIGGRAVREGVAKDQGLKTVGTQTPWIARNQMVGEFALF